MSSAPTQIAVAPSASIVGTTQIQKDYLDEPMSRQNSLNSRHNRGGSKGKHLTRSHAMRESTSPPRTPTPRSELLTPTSPTGLSPSSPETVDSRLHYSHNPSSTSSSPLLENPSIMFHNNNSNLSSNNYHNNQNNHQQLSPPQIFSTDGGGNQSQLDLDFPKLTPPKSKSPRPNNGYQNNNNNTNNSRDSEKSQSPTANEHYNKTIFCSGGTDTKQINQTSTSNTIATVTTSNSNNNTQSNESSLLMAVISTSTTQISQNHIPLQQNITNSSYEKENRPRDTSNTSTTNSTCAFQNEESLHSESPTDGLSRNGASGPSSIGKKHRGGGGGSSGGSGGTKGSKPRLKTMGSSSSVEGGNNSSGFISRDSSTDQFTDQSGVDLIQFFKETLNKNAKDRNMLMRIEKELHGLAMDRTRTQVRFPAMSSYNRMLIHRVAAYFGMEHNVDQSQQSVIADVTQATRVPEVRFKSLIRETFTEEPRKSILKRDAHSFDECRQFLGPDRAVLDRKAKSFEEREEEYEKVRRRIFKGRESKGDDEPHWHWSSSESSDHTISRIKAQNNRLLKVQSVEVKQTDGRPCVSKSHSFGGYAGHTSGPLIRGDSVTSTKSAGPRLFTKQDSTGSGNTPWRLSPSSSGYKTQSLRSDSVTPSPTGYGSGDHTPEPSIAQTPAISCGVVWAVTDMASVPRGSVLIDPQTLQPLVNQDGTIYHFDPSNLPPKSMSTKPPTQQRTNITPSNIKAKIEKQKSIKCLNDKDDLNNKTENIVQNMIHENVESITVITETESHDTKECEESPSPISDDNTKLTGSNNSLKIEFSNQKQQKSQATSPNLPLTAEFQLTQHNEITTSHAAVENDINPVPAVNTQTISQVNGTSLNDVKKEEFKPIQHQQQHQQQTIAVMSYAPSYSTIENGSVYPSGQSSQFSTYQQGADGSVYAVPQPMMYAYPPTMENDVPGYFVPIYDQAAGQQRDATLLAQSAATSLYQPPSTGTTTVVPLAAYPPPLYQGQVVYTQDQFSANTGTGQVPQYPLTYPVGYPYTYNGTTYQGYWGQPMTTYYVPQSQLTSTQTPVSTPMIVPQTSTNIQNHSNSISSNPNANSKRGTPPQSAQTQYTTHSSVPIQIPDPNTGTTTMYAIPPIYPGMLPYSNPPTGVLSHQIQHPQNTVINSVVPNPQNQIEQTSYHQINTTSSTTPQSAPSTPLSLPLPLPHQKNPPLFATPPIIPNGFTPQIGTIPLQNGENSCDRKTTNPNRRTNYVNSNLNRQNSNPTSSYIPQHINYQNHNPTKKPFDNITPRSNIIPPKRNDSYKPQSLSQIVPTNSNQNNTNNSNTNNNNGEKIRGPRPKPSNLDLRRSNSNRNTPSTNSTESNNSPNSITSNDQPPLYMTRSGATHLQQMHPQTATHMDPCHQQIISTYNSAGMYVKFGQPYFTHPSMALSSNRRSPPNDVRPQLTPITGMYPAMNVMLSAPRHMAPRPQNPNYKGNKPRSPRIYFNYN